MGWLTKIVAVLAVAGIGLFDAISIGTTAVTLTDQGSYAARDASETWKSTQNLQQAYNQAVASAIAQNRENVVDASTFRIDKDNTVHLTVSREAPTLLLFRWGRTHEWAKVERAAKGKALP
jgi:hypothetical protein